MNRVLLSCLLLAVFCVIGSSAAPLPNCPTHNPPNAFMTDLQPNFVSAIQGFLPEGKAVATSLLSQSTWQPNFHFDFTDTPGSSGQAFINVTILWEGAGYRNQFGYFTYTANADGSNPKDVKEFILYNDVSFPNSGEDYGSNPACLQPGVSTTIGPFTQGQRVGWFCYPNRVRSNKLTTLYSVTALNKKEASGENHVLVAELLNQYIIAFEDIAPLKNGDRDYNDIVFMASTSKAGKINVPQIPADCVDPFCSGRGVCNKETLTCTCATTSAASYYTGDRCEIITPCAAPCGAGVCTPTGCQCDPARYSSGCTACAANRYVFPTCDPCPKSCKEGCNVDGSCYIPPPPPPPNPPPACLAQPFLSASDYQVFVSGAFTGANSDIETRLAAGGDISLTQYSIGEALALTDDFNCNSFASGVNKNTLVSGGAINFASGNVRVGNIVFQTASNIGTGVTSSLAAGCAAGAGSVVDFASVFTWLSGLSRTFSKYSTNGQAYIDSSNKDMLILQGPTTIPSNGNYVWSVNGDLLAAAKLVTFTGVDITAKILIVNVNAAGGRFTFSSASYESVIASGFASRIIWNFNNARSISIQSIGLAGTILAPFAAVTGSDSVISGRIYAASFSGSTQVNQDLEGPNPCILSNIKIEVDDGACPPCLEGSVGSTGCKCVCVNTPVCVAPRVVDPAGGCGCVCSANPNCPLGVDPTTCQCNNAIAPVNNGQCSSAPFGWLSNFQIGTRGNTVVSSSYIGGRAAAGGSLSITRVSLGLDLVSTGTDDCSVSGTTFVSTGPATVVSGNVVGNLLYGSTSQFSYYIAVPPFPRKAFCDFPLYDPTQFVSGAPYSVGDAFGVIASLSSSLSDQTAFPTTGMYTLQVDIMTLYGANANIEVFSINPVDLANTRRIDVRGLGKANTIIINLVGTSVTFSKIGLQSLLPFSRLLIWNAPSATTFTVKNVALPGYIVAPNANIINPIGQIIGGAYVSSFSAKSNLYVPWLGAFAGCIPRDTTPKNCAACPAGYYRQTTECDCTPVVTISAAVSDFGFGTGYSVKYTINNAHSKPVSSVVVQFPSDPACPLQVNESGALQVFNVNAVAGVALQYSTPSWTGFAADGYIFIAVFYNAAGTCKPNQPVVPSIVGVTF